MMLYRVRVGGHLDAGWADWLGGLSITAEPDGTTLLAGTLPDQTALYGVLSKLHNLNLPLLSLQSIPPEMKDTRDEAHQDR